MIIFNIYRLMLFFTIFMALSEIKESQMFLSIFSNDYSTIYWEPIVYDIIYQQCM